MAGVQKARIQWAICLFLMLYFYALPAQAQYGGGTGEPNNPYLIYTAEQMNAIGAEPNDWDKNFKLMADIDMSGFSYNAALIAPDTNNATREFDGTPFSGVFDGNGHAISHLTITGGACLGLFGRLASGAEVKNLGVVDVNITNITGSESYIGGLVGYVSGFVIHCYSTGAVSSTGELSSYVGGLVGYNDEGYVADCYSTGSVTGTREVGGLVGVNHGITSACYSAAIVTGGSYRLKSSLNKRKKKQG